MSTYKTIRGTPFEIDDEDLIRIKVHRWYLGSGNIRNENDVTIGRFILNYNGDLTVDHIDRNIYNNKKENLRLATRQQQAINRSSIGSNKYKGVSWHKSNKNYRVRMRINHKEIFIGSFKTEKEAALVYNKAALKAYGEFAYLNKIKE